MKTLKQIEKEFDRLSHEIWQNNGFLTEEGSYHLKNIEFFYTKQIKEMVSRILTTLHVIRAQIPLTQGKWARRELKELIEKLERIYET